MTRQCWTIPQDTACFGTSRVTQSPEHQSVPFQGGRSPVAAGFLAGQGTKQAWFLFTKTVSENVPRMAASGVFFSSLSCRTRYVGYFECSKFAQQRASPSFGASLCMPCNVGHPLLLEAILLSPQFLLGLRERGQIESAGSSAEGNSRKKDEDPEFNLVHMRSAFLKNS